jgi:uncharacterized protein YxeA
MKKVLFVLLYILVTVTLALPSCTKSTTTLHLAAA